MQPGDETRASNFSQPLRALIRYLTSPLHRFCRRRSSLTLSISFVGLVIFVNTAPRIRGDLKQAMWDIEWGTLVEIAEEDIYTAPHAWEHATLAVAELTRLIDDTIIVALAATLIVAPRRAGVMLLVILVISITAGGSQVVRWEIEDFRLAAFDTPEVSTPLVRQLLLNVRWLIRNFIGLAAFPACLGFWYVAIARRHVGSGIEFDGRMWDAAPPVWRSLVIAVLVAILIQFWEPRYDVLRHLAQSVLVGGHPEFVAEFTKPQYWNHAALLLVLACGILVCALRRRAMRTPLLVLTALVTVSRVLGFGFRETPYTAWAFLHEYVPIIVALTALFCHAQESDWTKERHVVCGACGYFMGGSDGSKCPECGSVRPRRERTERASASGR